MANTAMKLDKHALEVLKFLENGGKTRRAIYNHAGSEGTQRLVELVDFGLLQVSSQGSPPTFHLTDLAEDLLKTAHNEVAEVLSLEKDLSDRFSKAPVERGGEVDREQQKGMFERSGQVTSREVLPGLFYSLLRDGVVSPAELEARVTYAESLADREILYSNGWLAAYAIDLARRLADAEEASIVAEYQQEKGLDEATARQELGLSALSLKVEEAGPRDVSDKDVN